MFNSKKWKREARRQLKFQKYLCKSFALQIKLETAKKLKSTRLNYLFTFIVLSCASCKILRANCSTTIQLSSIDYNVPDTFYCVIYSLRKRRKWVCFNQFLHKSERNGFETSLLIDLLMVSLLAELLSVKCHFWSLTARKLDEYSILCVQWWLRALLTQTLS